MLKFLPDLSSFVLNLTISLGVKQPAIISFNRIQFKWHLPHTPRRLALHCVGAYPRGPHGLLLPCSPARPAGVLSPPEPLQTHSALEPRSLTIQVVSAARHRGPPRPRRPVPHCILVDCARRRSLGDSAFRHGCCKGRGREPADAAAP